MTSKDRFLSPHSHHFAKHNHSGEQKTYYVLALTVVTMLVEIIAGSYYGSMALLADGWHMGTHAAAFCITLFTYHYSKKHAHSDDFSFGTGKVSVLGGFTSAIALSLVSLLMIVESIHRLFSPQQIQFNEAIIVAIVGLIINTICMWLLHDNHHHDANGHHHNHNHHEHEHEHEHHHDHNLKAAYLHVLADALTSLLAIAALIIGKFLGIIWLDSIMGIVGAIVIINWAVALVKQTSPILLDASISDQEKQQIKSQLTQLGAKVTDLHIWKISADHYSAAIVLQSDQTVNSENYKRSLEKFVKIKHLTLEINQEE
ncbi:transporter [Vibrio sp. MACH09]|uniref:CDF family Co(II)/Ni(II) efflux transporter DmeF n=1 Tax=Vibrio sp. MACH09 TaxID=3025122 RepID=UPI00278D07A9|nr:CDF family Co(II)/Ni(II) efflux transporter DmeF [Vibrio sp. MACH09]GLO63254.1 transporter [Vibrio sp. MACH09]